ncbi:hypothetical protein NEIPOLOT_00955 [Neisseria polysaccharea ATCC 43768]|nr:hypothetical protein NEIPOLOT_00955 [Neisseria polysaccharea ATCC 43768]
MQIRLSGRRQQRGGKGQHTDCAVWLFLCGENTVCRRTNLPDMAAVWLVGRDFSIKCRLKWRSDGICFKQV